MMVPNNKNVDYQKILKTIFYYVGKAVEENKVDNVLILMASMARDLLIADRCTVWLLDKKNKQLWTKVAHGIDEIRIRQDAGVVGYSISNGIDVLIEDAYLDSRFNRDIDRQTGYQTKSILVVPLRNNDNEVIGAFQAVNKKTDEKKFSDDDLEFLRLASAYSASSIESAMLHQEIIDTQKDIIFSMAEIGELRSKETGNHVKRVAEYSKLLALNLGLDEEEAEMIKLASPMHDIGKVGIPDSILKKPGRLDREEFEIMKTHATLGYEMLKDSKRKILKMASIIAGEHHEKYDGTGYPRGMQGENIHIYGRITAVADVFDALASDRVYKKAWSLGEVIRFFKEQRGKHFDPKLVDILFDNLSDFIEIRNRLRDDFFAEEEGTKEEVVEVVA